MMDVIMKGGRALQGIDMIVVFAQCALLNSVQNGAVIVSLESGEEATVQPSEYRAPVAFHTLPVNGNYYS